MITYFKGAREISGIKLKETLTKKFGNNGIYK